MKVFWSADEVGAVIKGGALAIGNFDGIHRGHQALVDKALSLSQNAAVLTFSPHPSELLHDHHEHFYLVNDEQKIALLAKLGLKALIIQPIDQGFLQLSPQDFVAKYLVEKLKVKQVIVGDDFSFGNKAAGGVQTLQHLGDLFGFKTHVVKEVTVDGLRCASTAIRAFLQEGDVRPAARLLGRPFSLRGLVQSGQQQGRKLGFATANVMPPSGFLLKRGVYESVLRVLSEPVKDFVSITNVGIRPTVTNDRKLVVESHCLFDNPELYGKTVEVFFLERVRDEQAFSSLTALQEQVQKDCQAVRQSYHQDPARFRIKS